MSKPHINFLIKLFIVTAVVAIGGTLIFETMPWEQPRVFYFIIGFFLLLTIFIHWWLTGVLKKNIRRFPAYFMGATTIKLFASMIFIVLYSIKNPHEAKTFLVTFFLIYLVYTAFETTEIITHSNRYRNQSKADNTNS